MSAFKPGSVVVHRPSESLWRVQHWVAEGSVMLLEPFMTMPDSRTRTGVGSGTMWAFEKDVVAVEKPIAGRSNDNTPVSKPEVARTGSGSAQTANIFDTAFGSCSRGVSERAQERRQLDPRFVVRRDPQQPSRGRGVFALQDVRAGTEVMRARPAAAVVQARDKKTRCACCFKNVFIPGREPPRVSVCTTCDYVFCKECTDKDEFQQSVEFQVHRESCKFCSTLEQSPVGNVTEADPELLRLVADCLARRNRGLVDDAAWGEIQRLESKNAGGSVEGLSDRALKDVQIRMENIMDLNISEDDIQGMYCRVCRNLHPFNPQVASPKPAGAIGLFPTAALVNHSCRPNACFHASMVKDPADKRPTTIEFVLRTMLDVRAGEEVCVSYLETFVMSVEERRQMLEGRWGFLCDCSRCTEEINDKSRTDVLPVDAEASVLISKLNQVVEERTRCGERRSPYRRDSGSMSALTGTDDTNQDEDNDAEDATALVTSSLQFMTLHAEKAISKHIYLRLAQTTLMMAKVVDINDEKTLFTVYAHVNRATENAGLRDPAMFRILTAQCNLARKLAVRERGRPEEVCHHAVSVRCAADAAANAEICYGSEHELTKGMREQLESMQKWQKSCRSAILR